ncbi:Lsr2 family protein [Dactylosporangium sp. NPDC000521]|uniref:histone-like nucleoid-structuring protein Lsr2 n=1 Tax=Dactylosporangium sp. NPDC000521 TaxID=3363975 RepID=UPI0036917176
MITILSVAAHCSCEGIPMAKRVIHELIDDLDGKPADETVTFGVDGVEYRIDLSASNASRLRDVLSPFVSAGTRVRADGPGSARARSQPAKPSEPLRAERARNQAIREWAAANGIFVSPRGRIAQQVIDQYRAENPK